MKTICLQLGNTDGRLTVDGWADFVFEVKSLVSKYCCHLHFFGGPANWSGFQNVCFVFQVDAKYEFLKQEIIEIRKIYKQNSVAWFESSSVEFI